MHERYLSQIKDKDKIKAWKWQRKSNIKECTQPLIVSAQEQAVKTNCVKFDKDKTTESPLCRICVVENETVSHAVSKYVMLSQKEIKRGMKIYAGILITEYVKNMVLKEHHNGRSMSQMVALRTNREILWDFTIQYDIKIEARGPYIVIFFFVFKLIPQI